MAFDTSSNQIEGGLYEMSTVIGDQAISVECPLKSNFSLSLYEVGEDSEGAQILELKDEEDILQMAQFLETVSVFLKQRLAMKKQLVKP